MNILYVGHLNENSGWGVACRNMLKSLATTGHNLVARSQFDRNDHPGDETTREFTSKRLHKPDVVIQHILPTLYEYNGRWKNVAYYVAEGTVTASRWNLKLEMMDGIAAPHPDILPIDDNCRQVHQVIHHACDTNRYQKHAKPNDGVYRFYTIADMNYRKNLYDLIRAYYAAFDFWEPVELAIKISGDPKHCSQYVVSIAEDVKTNMRMNADKTYPPIAVISENLNDVGIDNLHRNCNCFVTSSLGEGWNQPCFDAYAFGNRVLHPNSEPYRQYSHYEGTPVFDDICYGYSQFFDTAYTGRDSWYQPSVDDLSKEMRRMYKEKTPNAVPDVSEFGYKSVGQQWNNFLERVVK